MYIIYMYASIYVRIPVCVDDSFGSEYQVALQDSNIYSM